jgi:phospholipid-binding lipoprotein MlaA
MTVNNRPGSSPMRVIATFLLAWTVCGCSTMDGAEQGPEYGVYDPFETANRGSYVLTEKIDGAILKPVAKGYQKITPGWFRTGVSNFFSNLRSVDSVINGLLQGKPGSAAIDLSRIVINTAVGFGGVVDVASRAGLDFQDEDLGQTMAVWGVTRTDYVYVPAFGPTTSRDAFSLTIQALLPRLLLGNVYGIWMAGLDLITVRANALSLTDARDATALDPYAFTREAYFQQRQFKIYDGDPPIDEFDDFFDESDEE